VAKVIRRTIPYEGKRPSVLKIYPIGCTHLGAAASDEQRLASVVKRIEEDDDAYWIGMGDYGDFINRNDKRFDATTLAPWLREHLNDLSRVQTKRFNSHIRPIAGKCLGLLEGNHERCQTSRFERNVFLDMVEAVKSMAGHAEDYPLALGYTGWVVLSLPKTSDGSTKRGVNTLTINCHHGSGGATTRGGRLNKLEKYANMVEADLVLVGHMHDSMKVPIHRRCVRGTKEVTKPRWAALTGAFLDTRNPDGYVTYGEEKMYAPLPPSNIVVEWTPGTIDPYRVIQIKEEW
jgi:hypothetical protein